MQFLQELLINYKRLSKQEAVVLNKDKHHLLTKFVEIYFYFRPYIAIKPPEFKISKNCQRIFVLLKRKGKIPCLSADNVGETLSHGSRKTRLANKEKIEILNEKICCRNHDLKALCSQKVTRTWYFNVLHGILMEEVLNAPKGGWQAIFFIWWEGVIS